jgi:hypothetical protein
MANRWYFMQRHTGIGKTCRQHHDEHSQMPCWAGKNFNAAWNRGEEWAQVSSRKGKEEDVAYRTDG